MADWNKPLLTDGYGNFLAFLKALSADLAKGNDPAKTTTTNPFVDMIRWNSTSGKWELYSGTAWGDLAATYNINVASLGGSAAALYAKLSSPTFSGSPTAPTPDSAANNTQLATTAFVQLIKTGMIDGAPANLNTLNKLAASLGNDPSFATTYNTAWSNHLAASDPHAQYAFDTDLTTHAGVAATTTVVGHTRLATTAETTTGTATNIATHPAGVAAAIAAAMAGLPTGGGGGMAVFTTSGIFTVPDGVTTIYVTGCGGGGGGAGAYWNGATAYFAGGGGGGAAFAECVPCTVVGGQQYTITIGAGGSGGAINTNGGAGGTTSVGGLITILGGGGGISSTGAGGAAGLVSVLTGVDGSAGGAGNTVMASSAVGGQGKYSGFNTVGVTSGIVGVGSNAKFAGCGGAGGGINYSSYTYTRYAGGQGVKGFLIIQW